ncbi:hypothetical protein BC941DRAFT_223643, partial [Chlamydoabsidia padenii]
TSSQQDLVHGFGSSHSFGFNNNKPFELAYNEIYDQQSFTDDVIEQYSSVESPQSYIRIGMAPHGGVTSLLNHDQVSSSLFANDGVTPYDLPDEYTGFHSTTGMLPPSPTSPTTLVNSGTTTTTTTTTIKKQKKVRSTLSQRTSPLQQQQQQQQQQQKSHVCPVTDCQRRFKRLEHLKRHMRIHTLERPFACSYPKCHKHFSRSDNLSQHMKTHLHRQDSKRRTTESSSPAIMDDEFASPNHQQSSSSMGTYTDAISSSCWSLSSEFLGC